MSIKEENLIQYFGTLKAGQRLVKVGDTFMPVGVGGAFEPGAGGSAKYYKCASVDTSAKTWTGYELILSDGKYTVSETLTSGLSYTSITPVAGTVYSEDALVKVAAYAQTFPTDGLVFYAPLSTASTTAETGQTLTVEGSVTHGVVGNIPCGYFDGNTEMTMNDGTNIPTGHFARTLSLWCKSVSTETKLWDYIFGYAGRSTPGEAFIISIYEGSEIGVDLYNSRTTTSSLATDLTKWNHVLVTFSDSIVRFYLNGSLVQENSDIVINTVFEKIILGAEGSWYFNGYLAGCRIYNRVLSQEEITALASEFTPTE